jgi:predicted DNA-binding protein with PD1-like motif
VDWKSIDRAYIIRLYPGEEVVAKLAEWTDTVGLSGGTIEGLGGVKEVELGYFDLNSKSYHRWSSPGNWELVHLWGNLTLRDGTPFWHIHAAISDRAGNCKAGHLFSAQVAVTAELVVRPWSDTIRRTPDEVTGLDLWNLAE